MGPYTAGEVNDSIRRAIARFQRDATRLGGPAFAATVKRVIDGSQGFGDAASEGRFDANSWGSIDLESPTSFWDAGPTLSQTFPPGISTAVPYNQVTASNVAASAATVPFSLTNTLNNLVNEIDAGSGALVRGTENYYAALTRIQDIQQAAAHGVPVDAYVASKATTNTVNELFHDGRFLGIPLWGIAVAVGLFIVSGERRAGGRR